MKRKRFGFLLTTVCWSAISLFTITQASAQVSSVASAAWNLGTTWSGGSVPLPTDDVIISAGHTVTLDVNSTITNLTVTGTLTIGNSTTGRVLTVQGTTTVNATGTITAGASAATHSLILQGDILNNGTMVLTPSATRIINVNCSANLTNNATFTSVSPATITFDGTTTVGGSTAAGFPNVLITGTLNAHPTNMNVGGNWTNNGTFTPGTGTVTFIGTGAQQISSGSLTSETFYHLTVLKTAATLLNTGGTITTLNIAGNYTQTLGNFTAPATMNVAGNISNTAGAMTAGALIDIKGNWSGNGVNFVHASGLVTFTGTADQTALGTPPPTFYNLTVNKTAGTTLTTANTTTTITAANNFTMTEGNFTLAGGIMAVGGNWIHEAGTFNPGSGVGYVNFNGAGLQQISSSTLTTETFHRFRVTKTAGTVLSTGGTITTLAIGSDCEIFTGNFTAPATLTVAGNVLVNSGTLTAGALIDVKGNWTNNGGTFTQGTGTVSFTGTGAQTINGSAATQTFYNFTINKTAGTLLNTGGSTTIVAVQNDYTQTQGNFTGPSMLLVGGNWTHEAGTFGGTLTFNGAGPQLISSSSLTTETMGTMTVAKTAGTVLSVGGTITTLTLGGGYAHNSGNFNAPPVFNIATAVTLTGGTLFSGAAVNAGGSWTNNGGTFDQGTGTVTFNGSGVQTINGTATSQTFYNFTVNKAGATLLNTGGSTTTITIQNNFAQTQGNFAAPATLNLAGNWTHTGGSIGAPVTLVFNGAGPQLISSSSQPLVSFSNVTINKASGSQLSTGGLTQLSVFGYTQIQGDFTPPPTLSVGGNWVHDGGAFNPGTGTISFTGLTSTISSTSLTTETFNHMTFNKIVGNNLSVTGTITTLVVEGNFLQSSGNFNAPASVIIGGNVSLSPTNAWTAGALTEVRGNWAGSAFSPGTGTVTFTGTGPQTISSPLPGFNNLIINKSTGTALTTAPAATTQSVNNLTMTSGDLTLGGGSLSVSGSWNHNAGTFTPGSGEVVFTGGAAQVISSTSLTDETFNNFRVNKTAGTLLSTGGTITTITIGATYTNTQGNFAAPATLNALGNVILTAGTVTAGALIDAKGNWTNNGATFAPATGTVAFTGTGAQTINGTVVTQTFYNFNVNKTAGVLLNTGGSVATLTVQNNYTHNQGSFSAPGTFNVGGNWTRDGGAVTAVVNFNGAGAQVISSSILTTETFVALSINKTAGSMLSTGGTITTITTSTYTHTQGNFTLPATFNAGTITLTAGTLFSGEAVNVGLHWINNGGTFNPGTGTVTFNSGIAAQNIGGTALTQNFYDLVINKAGGNSLNVIASTTTLNVLNDLTMTLGNFFPATTVMVNIGGDWIHVAGSLSPGVSNITFNGAGSQQIFSPSIVNEMFNNVTVNKPAGTTLTAGGTITHIIIGGLYVHTLGEFNAPTTLTFTGNASLSGGIVRGGATVNVIGNWTNNGGTFVPGTGTVSFNGTGAQAINGTALSHTFNNFTINKTAGQTLSTGGSATSLTIQGNYTQTQGNFSPGSTITVNVGGNWTRTAGTFTAGTGTIAFNGTGAQQIITGSATTEAFNHLTINKSPGSLLNTGGVITAISVTGNYSQLAGDFTAPANWNLSGNFSHEAGTFNHTTIVFNGATGQLISSASLTTETFNNVTLSKAGTLTVGGTTTTVGVTGNYLQTTGNFTAPATLNIAGNVTLSAGILTGGALIDAKGNWTNNGATFTQGTGTVSFTGTGPQTINGTAAAQTFYNFTINKTAGTLLNTGGSTTTLTVQNNHTQTQGNFSAPAAFNVGGNWTHDAGTLSGSSFTFNGAGPQVISSSSLTTENFGLMTVNKTGGSMLNTGGTISTIAVGTSYIHTLGNFNAPATFTVGGAVTLTAGTLFSGTSITVGLNWTNNGGTFDPGTGTVIFNHATSPQNINGTAATQTFYNLTISKGAGAALAVAGSTSQLNVENNFTLTTGSFTPNAGLVIRVGGNWNHDGGTFTPGTSHVMFDGAGDQLIASTSLTTETFNILSVNNTGGVLSVGGTLTTIVSATYSNLLGVFDPQVAMTVSGSVSLMGGTLMGGTLIDVKGNWTNNGGTFSPGTGTVSFTGTGAQAINGTAVTQTFNHLTINKTVGQMLSTGGSTTTLTLTGNLLQSQGNFTAPATLTVGGDLTQTTGILIAGALTDLKGNWNASASSSFSQGTGTVTFTGSGDQSITAVAGPIFFNLTVNKTAGTLTSPAGTFTIQNNFTQTQGNFNLIGSVSVAGNWTHEAGTFTPSSGTGVTFNGTGAQSITSSSLTAEAFFNLTVNKTAGTLLSVSGTVTTLEATGTFTQTQGNFTAPATFNAGNISHTAGTFTAGALIDVKGNWTRAASSVFTAGTGTVSFTGTGAQVVGNINAPWFYNIIVNKTAGTVTYSATGLPTITNNVAIVQGSLTFSGSIFAIGNNFTQNAGVFNISNTPLSVGGNWTREGGTVTFGTIEVTFNGTGAQQISSSILTTETFHHLTVNKSGGTLTVGGTITALDLTGNFSHIGNFTAPATFTVAGNISQLTSGTFTAGALVDLKGNWTKSSTTTFAPGTGTVAFTGTGAQSISGTASSMTFYNFTINKTEGQTLTLGGSTITMSIQNNYSQLQGNFTSASTFITVGGNWTHDAGTFTFSSGTLVFDGAGNQQIFSSVFTTEAFGYLAVSKAGGTLSTGGTINTITVQSNYTHLLGSFTMPATFTNQGGMTLAGGTVTAGALLQVHGIWNNSGTAFVPGTGTVSFLGSGSVNVTGAGTQNFYNIVVNKTGGSTISFGAMTLVNANDFTLTDGIFTGPVTFNVANALHTSGNWTSGANLNISGNWTRNGGLFIPGTNTVTFNSSAGQQNINGSQSTTFGRLTFNNAFSTSPQIVISAPVMVNTQMTMTSGIVQTDAVNVITLANAATTTSGSAACYISGPMRYNMAVSGVNTTLNFPIGKSGVYGAASLTVQHSAVTSYTYTAEVIHTPATSLQYATAPGTTWVSPLRYLDIRRGLTASPGVTDNTNLTTGVDGPRLQLNYQASDGVTDPANLTMVKNAGGGTTWFDIGGTASGAPAGNISMAASSTNFTTFSQFCLANHTGGTNLQLIAAISSFTPLSGPVGTPVTITGNNFEVTPSNNIVRFGATRATVTNATSTQLTVTVPSGATYQPVSVLVTGLTALSNQPFTTSFSGGGVINTGSFGPAVNFASGTGPSANAIGDLDGDGKPDLVVLNTVSNLVSVYRNASAAGTFSAGSLAGPVDFAAANLPVSIMIADLDGDGKLDLATSNQTSATISIFRNTSTVGSITAGSFAAKVDFATGSSPNGIAVLDYDLDGRLDLAVASAGTNSVGVFKNTATPGVINAGSLAARVDFATGDSPAFIAAGDLDGDGKTDLSVSNSSSATVSVLRNTGIPGSPLAPRVDFPAGAAPNGISIADFDGDAKPDMAVANFDSNTVSVFRNTSSSGTINAGSFAAKVDFATGSHPNDVTVGDLDGDGLPDMAVENTDSQTVSVFKNTSSTGSITVSSFAAKTDFVTGAGPQGVSIGDMDGDGETDLVVCNSSNATVSVMRYRFHQAITFNPLTSKTYGDAVFVLGAVSTSGLTVDYLSDNTDVATVSGNNVTIVGAGDAMITARQIGNDTYSPATNVLQNLVVDQAVLNALADDKVKTYGALNPVFTIGYTGFVGTDDAGDIDTAPAAATAATQFSNVGTYAITLTGGDDDDYLIVKSNGTLTVNQSALIATADDKTKTYRAVNPAFTINYSGFLGTDNAGVLDTPPVASSTATQFSNVGSFPVTLSTGTDNNYSITLNDGTLEITPALLTATADDQSKVYGELNPALTISYSGFVGTDDASVIDTPPAIGTGAVQYSDAGPYAITLTGGTDNNYSLANNNGTLTVVQAPLTATGADASKTYGDVNPSFTFTWSGFVGSDDDGDIDTSPVAGSTATKFSDAGTYPIAVSGGADTNYSISYTDGVLTINRAPLTVTADDQSKTYGEVNPDFTFTYSGFLGTDDEADIDTSPVPSSTAVQLSNAGTYAISLSGGGDNNYTFDLNEGTLEIDKALLTATADGQSKTYGAVNPALTIGYTGFAGTDDEDDLDTPPVGSTNATAFSNTGSYPIFLSGGTDNNYTFSLNDGTLTINKGNLTAKADDQSKTYGSVNPAFTISYTGFAGADHAGVVVTPPAAGTTATQFSDTGSYAITLSGGVDNNYTFTLQDGTLTVGKSGQVITFGALADKTLGDPVFTLNATASSGLSVAFSTTSDKLTLSGSSVTLVKAGRAGIQADQAGSVNYNAAPAVQQSFCVNPPKPTVTVSGANTTSVLSSSATEGNQWYLNGTIISGATGKTFNATTGGVYKVRVGADDCVSDFSADTPIVITGDVGISAGIRVYPNPASEYLEVLGLHQPASSQIFDMTGRIESVRLERRGDVHRADVHHLASGVYLLRIEEGSDLYQIKFVKK